MQSILVCEHLYNTIKSFKNKEKNVILYILVYMKNKTAKQHYVPRAFLKRWTINEKFYPIKASKISLEETKILNETGVDPFCFENYFYANERGKEDDFSQYVEKFLTRVEKEMYRIIEDFENKILNNQKITEKDRIKIAEILSFFDIRGKRGAERSDNMVQQIFDQLSEKENLSGDEILRMLGATSDNVIIKGKQVQMSTKQHLKQMNNLENRIVHLINKDWIIQVSRVGDFIVTDNPSFEICPQDNGIFSQTIYDRTQVFILSPKVVIFIRKPESVKNVRYFLDLQEVPKSLNFNYIDDITNFSEKIDAINSVLFDYSVRFGFHSNKSILERILVYTKSHVTNITK